MKVVEGSFGEKNKKSEEPTGQDLLDLINEQFSGKIEHIFCCLELDSGDTVTISNLELSQQIMWMELVKFSFLFNSGIVQEDG